MSGVAYSVTQAFVSHIKRLGHRCSSRVPKSTEGTFVTVERTGGPSASCVDHPVIAIQTWADTESDAEALANDLRISLLYEGKPKGVRSISVNSGPYAFFDNNTGKPRYQLVLSATCKI